MIVLFLLLEFSLLKKSNEQIAPIMDAISNDKVDIFQVNIQNNGNIPGLPNDFFC